MTRLRWLVLLLALLPLPLGAQAIRVEGDLQHPAASLLREIVGGDYLLLARDTVLGPDFRAPGDVVVLRAEVRLEGTVEGSVAVLDGDLFIRPGARIAGRVVTVGGGYYRSGLASTGEVLEVPLRATSSVEAEGERTVVRLVAPPRPPLLSLPGLAGIGLPTYDRVDGLTLRVGARANLAGDTLLTTARLTAAYHLARNRPGLEVALDHPLRAGLWVTLAAARRTATNEAWIRGDLENSLAALVVGTDARDYWETDEVALTLARRPRQPLIAGEGRVLPRITLRASRDRALAASDVWSLFGDDWRPNLQVAEGTLASAVGGAAAEWKGQTTTFLGDAAVEWAPGGVGDFQFVQAVATGEWTAVALWMHTLELFAHTRFTLTDDPAPPQRWSFVGGSGTLSTLGLAELRGDRVVYVESAYAIPLPRVKVPVLGAPSLRLEHGVGSAWISGLPSPRWEQALGAGLDFGLVKAMVVVDPAEDSLRPELNLSASFPF